MTHRPAPFPMRTLPDGDPAARPARSASLPRTFALLMLAFLGPVAGSVTRAATVAEYYPLVTGSEWRYSAGSAQVIRRIPSAAVPLHGVSAAGFRSAVNGQFVDVYWWSTFHGLTLHRIDQEEGASPAGIRFREPLEYAPAKLAAGNTKTFSASYGYVDTGGAEPFSWDGAVQGTTTVSGPESVSTAAGTFACYRISFDETWTEFGDVVYRGVTTLWLASGVGVVKATDSSGVVLELQSYSIPGGGPPVITSQPTGRTVAPGASVVFEVTATGAAPLAYQWRKDGVNIAEATQSRLTLAAVKATDAGTYTVEVTNVNGKTLSAPAVLQVETIQPPEAPSITAVRRLPSGELETTFRAAAGKTWQFEFSNDLRVWNPLAGVTADGPGTRRLGIAAGETHRFFRLREGVAPPADLTLPTPGQLYPGGTRLGGDLFGFEFTIPTAWKGGLRVNSPWMMFASDTEPGLIVGLLGFAGTREQLLQDPSLRDGFETDLDANTKLFFRAVRPVAAGTGNRLSAGFAATGTDGTAYALDLEFLVHPDGGFLGFLGLTTQAKIDGLRVQLAQFVGSAKTPARNTLNEYIQSLSGRSFKWESGGNEWYSGNWQGSASSTSWSESYAFFCSDGSFEINKESTSYVSTRNSGGWSSQYMSLSYGSTTKEYGQFTIVQHPQHGSLMLIATLAGYQVTPVRLQPDGSLLLGKNQLRPYDVFNCGGR